MKLIKCIKCNAELDTSHFKKYSKSVDGLWYHSTCRQCEISQEFDGELLLCHICNKFLPLSHFQANKNNASRNYKDRRCRDCKTTQNKERRLKYSEDEKFDKIIQTRFYAARQRALDKNLPFDLDVEFLKEMFDKQNKKCAISGIEMTFDLDKGRTFSNMSIDQINPAMGYTKDNVQFVCMAINQLKSDFTMELVLKICTNILKNNEII